MNTVIFKMSDVKSIKLLPLETLNPREFPFLEFKLKVYTETGKIIEDKVKILDEPNNQIILKTNNRTFLGSWEENNLDNNKWIEIGGEKDERFATGMGSAFILQLRYIMSAIEERKKTLIRKPINQEKKPNQCSKRFDKNIYFLDDLVEYAYDSKRKSCFEYQCECWGVRGHYRHYKNGNTVFIKAYQKGKKRNEIEAEPKTYIL